MTPSPQRWFKDHSTVIAAATLVVSVVALVGAIGALAWQVQDQADERELEEAARVLVCEQSNRLRYGGEDYIRPVIRALVAIAGHEQVEEIVRQSGLPSSAADVSDIPALDCETGQPVPIPQAGGSP